MTRPQVSRVEYTLVALFAFVASAWLFGQWIGSAGIPSRERLAPVSGEVIEVGSTERGASKHGVRFTLAGVAGHFNYPARGGEPLLVREALGRGRHSRATVLIDAQQTQTVARNPDLVVNVYEIELDGKMIRSLAQVEAAWRQHHAWGAGFGVLLMIVSGLALARAWKPEGGVASAARKR